MILFAGENIKRPGYFSINPPSTSIKKGTWNQVNTDRSRVYYCDFSPNGKQAITDKNSFLAISGDPVIIDDKAKHNNQLELINSAFLEDDLNNTLPKSNGVYCLVYLNKLSDELVIATDHIGLRKIYLYQDNDRLIFSNALWLMEEVINKPLSFNIESIVEIGTLGYPLDNRTKFNEIVTLSPGSSLRLIPEKAAMTTKHIDITSTPIDKNITEIEAVDLLHTNWKNAVCDRLNGRPNVFGFLSGGMDSRLLLHTLRTLGSNVFSANFAPKGTCDLVFGKMAAQSIGTTHFQHPVEDPLKDLATDTITAWIVAEAPRSDFFKKDPLIWSGDGGSVGLGHVYLTDEITSLAAKRDFSSAAMLFCKENKRQVPSRLFKDKSAMSKLVERIDSSMTRCGTTNAEKAPYYFLMLNDQRRHMDNHYESFHERGFDFALPFFDKRLITFIASLPSSWLNSHRIYDKLYNLIGGTLTATAWQTYPGHIPCKLDIPEGLVYQWEASFYSSKSQKRAAAEEARSCLKLAMLSHKSPFSPVYTFLALMLTVLNISNYGYITKYIKPLIVQHKDRH